MIQRLLFGLIFIALGALAAGWWHNRVLIVEQESARINAFMSAGARFTAQDGQALCERVAELEKHSIGFQRSGIHPLPCEFGK